jgi:hypothetical protein
MEFDFNEMLSVPKDKFTAVPEDFRPLYAEKDGAYVLRTDDPSVGSAVKAVTGLNRSLKAARAEAQGLKGKLPDLSKLSEFGDTPDAILEGFTTRINELQTAAKTKTGEELTRQVTKIKEDLGTAHRSELEKHTKRIEALTGQLHGLLVTSSATAALAQAEVIDAELVLPFIHQQVRVGEENGKFTVSVIDKAGDPRYSGVTGAPMTIAELVQEMKAAEKYAPLFKSSSHSGGGAGQGGGGRQGVIPPNTRSSTGKISHALENRGRR